MTQAVSPTRQSGGVTNFASGSFTSSGVAAIVTLGFVPRYVKVVNSTDALVWEKLEGMAAADSVNALPGTTGASDTVTQLVDTGSAILINSDGTLTLSSTLCGTAKAISFVAFG